MDIMKARRFCSAVTALAKKCGLNVFVVTDGASAISNNGNECVEFHRICQRDWELENGYNPDADWSEKSSFERALKEDSNEGLEFVPNGKGGTAVKSITTKYKSHKTTNKLSDVEKYTGVEAPNKVDVKRAKAVYNYLKDHDKLDDVKDEFNTDPAPDLQFNALGDVVVQPDDGSASYKIPERKLAQYD